MPRQRLAVDDQPQVGDVLLQAPRRERLVRGVDVSFPQVRRLHAVHVAVEDFEPLLGHGIHPFVTRFPLASSWSPCCRAVSRTFGDQVTCPESEPPRMASMRASSVPALRKPRMTPGGTEMTSHCSRITSLSPSSPQYTPHRPVSGMKTSTVGWSWGPTRLPGTFLTSVRLKSRASVIAGLRAASSVTPRPIRL